MKYPPGLLDEIRARLPVSQVVGRRVALRRQGREFIGLSPFRVEKSPSFTVNDQKGFYHCFSSGEHGDIFRFVMETEGLTFPEVVERLAEEAGVALPKATPEAVRQDDERKRLMQLVEASALFFERQLMSASGAEARDYLARRGVTPDLQRQFRMGYSPDGRGALKRHLADAGYPVGDMVTAGMLIGGSDIPDPYDRFRGRLMIPITDGRGRAIAFGGRALQPDAKPKYLNSPETPLFHKGSVLFNAATARAAAYETGALVVVEGYLDVVALASGGINQAVAPLGTALTQNQLALLWRMNPEPTLCFDGDEAGRKAAFKALDTALPHLTAGHTLQFAFLPKGLDPDDLMRSQGPDAVKAVLAGARPLSEVLWERETADGNFSTPERRAALEARLRTLVESIQDRDVRGQYQSSIRDRLFAFWRAQRTPLPKPAAAGRPPGQPAQRQGFQQGGQNGRSSGGGRPDKGKPGAPWRGGAGPIAASASLMAAVAQGAGAVPIGREALLMRTLVNHPWLLDEQSEDVARLTLKSRPLQSLRNALLSLHAGHRDGDEPLDRAAVLAHIVSDGLEHTLALIDSALTHRADRFAEPAAAPSEVTDGWRHTLEIHHRDVDLTADLATAERAYLDEPTEANWNGLREARERMTSAAA